MTKFRFQGVKVSKRQFNKILKAFEKGMRNGVKEFNKILGR